MKNRRNIELLYGQPFYFLHVLGLQYAATSVPAWQSAVHELCVRLRIGVAEVAFHVSKVIVESERDAVGANASIVLSPLLQLQRPVASLDLTAIYEEVKSRCPTDLRSTFDNVTIRSIWHNIKKVRLYRWDFS